MKHRTHKMWTKDEIRKVATLWEGKTTAEIAKELGREPIQVTSIATQMRKVGIPMARKHKNGYLNSLLHEVKQELR